MHRLSSRVAWLLALAAVSPASAQRSVAYDTVADGFPAAVTCGFCAGEKFGVVFYELPGGAGLRADDFPLTLRSVQLAVARIRVVGSALSGGYMCQGSNMEGTVDVTVEAFAGETVPMNVLNLPADGAWPGETQLFTTEATATVSTASMDGGSEFGVTLNEIALPDGGVSVEAPATYIRVVVTIPSGGASSSCSELGQMPPAAVAIRDDDGRVAPRRSLILANGVELGLPGVGLPAGWYWNEEIDEGAGSVGVNGDWAVRIAVDSVGTSGVDAGVSPGDAGIDGGSVDAGPIASDDASVGTDGGTTSACTVDTECGGGERCVAGRCERTTCTTTDECGGGRSCVDGRCRNLCDADRDCDGGEVCATSEGVCRPADEGGGGGCSCRTGTGSGPSMLFTLGALMLVARRRRR